MGGEGTPSEELFQQIEIQLSGATGGTFSINGVVITDYKWTYANWFSATGIPETWEILPSGGDKTAKTMSVKYGEFYDYDIGLLNFNINTLYYYHFKYLTGGAGEIPVTFDHEGVNIAIRMELIASLFFKTNGLSPPIDYDVLSVGLKNIGWQDEFQTCFQFWGETWWVEGEGEMDLEYSIFVPVGTKKQWSAVEWTEGKIKYLFVSSSVEDYTLSGVTFVDKCPYVLCVYSETTESESHGNPRPGDIIVKQSVIGTGIEEYCDQFSIDKKEYTVELNYGPGINERLM